MYKIIITIDVQDEKGSSLDATTAAVVETFQGEVVKKNVAVAGAAATKKKGNFSGAIAAIAKASTPEELREIRSLIDQREWTQNEFKTILAAYEAKVAEVGGAE